MTDARDAKINFSKNVYTPMGEIKYLVRFDSEPLLYFNTQEDAAVAVESIGDFEYNRIVQERGSRYLISKEVFRDSLGRALSLVIKSQSLGFLYNGSPVVEASIDSVSVCVGYVTDEGGSLTDEGGSLTERKRGTSGASEVRGSLNPIEAPAVTPESPVQEPKVPTPDATESETEETEPGSKTTE